MDFVLLLQSCLDLYKRKWVGSVKGQMCFECAILLNKDLPRNEGVVGSNPIFSFLKIQCNQCESIENTGFFNLINGCN